MHTCRGECVQRIFNELLLSATDGPYTESSPTREIKRWSSHPSYRSLDAHQLCHSWGVGPLINHTRVLTHTNFVAALHISRTLLAKSVAFSYDTSLSCLPTAHRCCTWYPIPFYTRVHQYSTLCHTPSVRLPTTLLYSLFFLTQRGAQPSHQHTYTV